MGRLSRGQSTASGPSAADRFRGGGHDAAFRKAQRLSQLSNASGAQRKAARAAAALRNAQAADRASRKPFTGRPPRIPRPLPQLDPGPFPFKRSPWGLALDLALTIGQNYTGWGLSQTQLSKDNYDFLGAGWTQYCNRARIPRDFVKVGQFNVTAAACPAGEVGTGGLLWGTAITGNPKRVQVVESNAPSPNANGRVFIGWNRIPDTLPLPIFYPNGKKIALPLPLPAPEPAQQTENETGSSSGLNSTASRSIGHSWNFSGGDRDGGRSLPPPDRPRPPGPGEKEKKTWILGKGGKAGNVFGALTEFMDAQACAVKAIKSNGGPGAPHMGLMRANRYIAENFDITDGSMVNDFINCMVESNIQDFVIGGLNRSASHAYTQATGGRNVRGVGIKRGPSPF